MLESSYMKCISCNIFYKLDKFIEKDIYSMRKDNKLLYCIECKKINMYKIIKNKYVLNNKI